MRYPALTDYTQCGLACALVSLRCSFAAHIVCAQFTPAQSAWFDVLSVMGVVFSTRLAPRLSNHMGKHASIIRLSYVELCWQVAPVVLRFVGLLWPNESAELFVFYLAYSLFGGVIASSMKSLAMAFFTDIVEESVARMVRRDEAIIFTTAAFTSRLAAISGLMLSGVVVHFAGVGAGGERVISATHSNALALLHLPLACGACLYSIRWLRCLHEDDIAEGIQQHGDAVRTKAGQAFEHLPAYGAEGMEVARQIGMLASVRDGGANHEAHRMQALASEPDEHSQSEQRLVGESSSDSSDPRHVLSLGVRDPRPDLV